MSNKNRWNYWGVVILTSLAPPSQRLLLDSNVSWDPVSYKRHIQLEVEMWRDRLILFSSGGEAWSPCWSTLAFLVVFFSSTCNSDSVSKELLFRVALASWWDSWNCVLKAHRGLKNTIVLPPQKYVSPAGICLKSTLSNMFTWPRCSCNFLSGLNQICHMEPSSSGHCSCEQWGQLTCHLLSCIPHGQSEGRFLRLHCCTREAGHMLCLQFPSQLEIPKSNHGQLIGTSKSI